MPRDIRHPDHRRPGPATADHLRRRASPGNAMAAQVVQQGTVQPGLSNATAASTRAQGPEEQRAELLTHVEGRLGVVREAQRRELQAMEVPNERHLTRELADAHRVEHTRPDPSRWHRCAKLYRAAADALCRGDLARGAGLLRSAEEAERAAFVSTSAAVDLSGVPLLEHPSEARRGVDGPLGNVALPFRVRELANHILATRPLSADSPVRQTDERAATVEAPASEEEEGADGERRRT